MELLYSGKSPRACLKKAFCKVGRADCGNDFSDTL